MTEPDYDKGRKAVVFIDSLGDDDLEYMPWVRENMTLGAMDAGDVYVTPTVMGSVYTGKSPTDHGLLATSRYNQPARTRPVGKTYPEMAAESTDAGYDNVATLWMPFIVPANVTPEGNYWHHSSAMDQHTSLPADFRPVMEIPAPAGAMNYPDENLDLCFNLRVDHCMTVFGTARNLMEQWDLDLACIGYRVTDSYVHYHYEKPENEPTTYRQDLLEQVDREIKYLANQADVFIYGDHGGMEMESVFRINQWLQEHGFLEIDIDFEWYDQAKEYEVVEPDENVPGEMIQTDAPFVTVDEANSVAISDDPFSGGITLLEGATEAEVKRLIDEMGAEGGIEKVAWTADLFGPGDYLEESPDLYAVREEGCFVSGNLHPEMGGAEVTRTGVHHRTGAFGTTTDMDIPSGPVTPVELHHLITDGFLGLDGTASGGGDDRVGQTDANVKEHLRDMGYL